MSEILFICRGPCAVLMIHIKDKRVHGATEGANKSPGFWKQNSHIPLTEGLGPNSASQQL